MHRVGIRAGRVRLCDDADHDETRRGSVHDGSRRPSGRHRTAGAEGARPLNPRAQSLAALGAFTLLSLLVFGRKVLLDPSGSTVGFATDPGVFAWHFTWWPHAIAHGLDPLVTDLVWAPVGSNLAKATGIPSAAIPAIPITLAFGPVVTYNILAVLAPALSAWTAFLLCRYVTGSLWPSVMGGFVFGFSSYEAAHALGHLNLTLVFLLPVTVLFVLRQLRGDLGARPFVLLLGAVLALEFGLSLEISATLAMFGAIALGLGYIIAPAWRKRLLAILPRIGIAYGLAVLVVSPYLYVFFFGPGGSESPIYDFYPSFFSIDALNLVVPTRSPGSAGELSMG